MELRWAVRYTGATTGNRCEATDDRGQPARYGKRVDALKRAAFFPDSANARIVKITTWPKGWQSSSSKPPDCMTVLLHSADDARRTFAGYWSGVAWRTVPSLTVAPGMVTHWRHLPKPPKDTK